MFTSYFSFQSQGKLSSSIEEILSKNVPKLEDFLNENDIVSYLK